MAGTPLALYFDLHASVGQTCTCPHGEGATCPMHKTVNPPNQQRTCAFRSAANPHTEAIVTLLGPVAVLASGVHVERPTSAASVVFDDSVFVSTISIPDAPPPRA